MEYTTRCTLVSYIIVGSRTCEGHGNATFSGPCQVASEFSDHLSIVYLEKYPEIEKRIHNMLTIVKCRHRVHQYVLQQRIHQPSIVLVAAAYASTNKNMNILLTLPIHTIGDFDLYFLPVAITLFCLRYSIVSCDY